jgi:ABC-type glycerol-3-phosphate transport system substrate-binding protein
MHGWAMFINPALFQKAGLPLRSPTSGAETIEWARTLTVDKKGNNGLSPNFDGNNVVQQGITVEWDIPTILTTLWSFGGNTLSPDGKTATLNTPQATAALSFWHDLIFKYHAAAKPASTNTQVAWANSRLAMWPNGDWMRNYFPLHKNVPVQAVYLPPFGQKDVAWMSGHVISCPAGLSGAKKDAAYTFMRWLSTRGLQWTSGAGHIPARISQRTQPAVLKLFPQRTYAPELAEIGHIEQPSTVFFDVQDAYEPQFSAILNGTTSVAAGLATAQQRVTKALANA